MDQNRFLQNRFILSELVKKGIRLKYRRSYLGIVWSLLEPLLTTAVLTIVFGTLFANKDPKFPVYILSGRLIYSFFSQGTTSALKSIRANSSLIKKVYVPKLLYPLSCILFNYIIFLISLIVMGLLCVIFKVTPTWHIVEALIPLFNLLLITTGCGLILSTVGVFFRDMEYLWTVLLMLVMYASAIFYKPERLLNSGYRFILELNPLYCVISDFRQCVIYGKSPCFHVYSLYAFIFGVVSIAVGLWAFKKNEDKFILNI